MRRLLHFALLVSVGFVFLSNTRVFAQRQRLLIWGGENHRTFLGCLNSSPMDSESIWNAYGNYGNKFSSISIWNSYGDFGNRFSSYSPWNEFSTTPPGIYDSRGNFYGYFTRNKVMMNRINTNLTDMICTYYDLIPEDVTKWYDKLFNELKIGL